MPETKPVIGLSWEPTLSSATITKSASSSNTVTNRSQPESSAIWKPSTELVDGLFLPPNNPKKLNKLLRKQLKDTSGSNWFDMPAPTVTPELQKDLQLLKLRNVMDPKRHYKKGDSKSTKYFQVGTVIESSLDFFSSRLTNKERKATLADELLSDHNLGHYRCVLFWFMPLIVVAYVHVVFRKRKVRDIEEKNRPGGNEKWKIKGKHSKKRAKQRRQ